MLLLVALPSWALTPPDVTGGRPGIDGTGILNEESARELALYGLAGNLQMQYAWRPLVVGSEAKVVRPLVDARTQADIGVAMRVYDHLTLGLSLPANVYQVGTQPSLYGPSSGALASDMGIGDLNIAAKYVFLPDKLGTWGAAALLRMTLPTGDPAAYLGRPGVTLAPSALASGSFGPWRLAMAVGLRLQSETTLFGNHDGSVLRWSVAGSLNPLIARQGWGKPWNPDVFWIDASLAHETPLTAPFSNARDERMEAALAVNWVLGEDLYASVGTSVGIWPGWGVPALRPFFSVRYGHPQRM